MTPEQARRLIAGYATNSLTDREREALFAAAMDDQEIFNELMAEQPLAELLSDPAAREELQESLAEVQPIRRARQVVALPAAAPAATLPAEPSVPEALAARQNRWIRSPWLAALAAGITFIMVGLGAYWVQSQRAPVHVAQKENISPPASPAPAQAASEKSAPESAEVDAPKEAENNATPVAPAARKATTEPLRRSEPVPQAKRADLDLKDAAPLGAASTQPKAEDAAALEKKVTEPAVPAIALPQPAPLPSVPPAAQTAAERAADKPVNAEQPVARSQLAQSVEVSANVAVIDTEVASLRTTFRDRTTGGVLSQPLPKGERIVVELEASRAMTIRIPTKTGSVRRDLRANKVEKIQIQLPDTDQLRLEVQLRSEELTDSAMSRQRARSAKTSPGGQVFEIRSANSVFFVPLN